MSKEFWRAVVIIEKDQSKEIDPTIEMLNRIGIDNIHLMVAPGVRISKKYEHISHQGSTSEWGNSYTQFRSSMELISRVYASRSELFLVIRPGIHIWSQLLTYCEATIPRDIVAVWSPLTPSRLFPTSQVVKPVCAGDHGWCPSPVSKDMVTSHCFVMTGHVMTLMAAYLPPLEDNAQVSSMIAEHLGRRHVPFYFHTPSLATSKDHDLFADEYVGTAFSMSQKVMRRGKRFILAPA